MSPPVGPTGLPEDCDGTSAPTWQVTAALDTMSTTIVFGGVHVHLDETAATATVTHFVSGRLGGSLTAGGIVAGSIEDKAIRDGATIGISASYLALLEQPARPFIAVSGSLGTALIGGTAMDGSARTWSATDLRVGGMVGKSFGKHVVPYLAARGFGGPVYWERDGAAVSGSDRWHVTAGAGVTLRLPARITGRGVPAAGRAAEGRRSWIDVSVEVMPLGEQSATVGVTAHL